MSKPSTTIQANSAAKWTDFRDENGKLCARLDARGMVLEIRRSDRKQIACFNLRDYVAELSAVDKGTKSE